MGLSQFQLQQNRFDVPIKNESTNCSDNSADSKKEFEFARGRKWSRWKSSFKFYISPVFSLCHLILRSNKLDLDNRNRVYRSESFRYMEKKKWIIPMGKAKDGVGVGGWDTNRIELTETYAEPLDSLLSHPHSGCHNFGSKESEQLELIQIQEPSYHESRTDINSSSKFGNDVEESLKLRLFYSLNIPDHPDQFDATCVRRGQNWEPGLEIRRDFDRSRVDPFLRYINVIISESKITSDTIYPVTNSYSSIEPFHDTSSRHRKIVGSSKKTTKRRRRRSLAVRESDRVDNPISNYDLCYCCRRSDTSMARKRYETAFLPSSSSTSDVNLHSPDADSLLLAIEGTSLTDSRLVDHHQHHHHRHTHHHNPTEARIMKHHRHIYNANENNDDDHDPSMSILPPSQNPQQTSSTQNSRTTSPSPYHLQFEEVQVHPQHQRGSGGGYSSSNSNSSSPHQRHHFICPGNSSETELEESQSNSLCSPRKLVRPNPNLPLSEPLPAKRYSNVSSIHRGSVHGHGPSDNRILTKDNSISSLESLDSNKSDDLQLLRQQFSFSRSSGQGQKATKSKLLSPISDKSPLEPKSLSQLHPLGTDFGSCKNDPNNLHFQSPIRNSKDTVAIGSKLGAWDDWSNPSKLSAAELANVPWEMPKLRRKLALMADSGISLDLPPPFHPPSILSMKPSFGGSNFPNFGRNRTLSSDFVSLSKSGLGGREATVLAATTTSSNSNNCFNPPLATCENFSLKKSHGVSNDTDDTSAAGSNNNDSGQWEKRGNLDLKLPLRRGGHDEDDSYWGSSGTGYYGSDSEIGGNYLPSSTKPDRSRVWLDFNSERNPVKIEFDSNLELESQDWFYGAITRAEAENVLRPTKEGSFLVRNCESSNFNQYSLSLKCARGFIHIRIEPNSLGTFSLGDQEFPSVPHLVLHFMTHRLPIKGAEHVKLIYPVINQLL